MLSKLEKNRLKARKYSRSEKGKAKIKEYRSREEVKEQVRASALRYTYSEKGKAKIKEYRKTEEFRLKRKANKQKHKVKVRARKLAEKIPKQKCEVDGCPNTGHKHHEDYSKPLEVVHLCIQHHSKLHRHAVI